MDTNDKTRIVTAPQAGTTDSSGQLISVELHPDEEVLWHWTHYPDGHSSVTGYEVVRKSEK
ncbi:MAG TPA: hypothetical protein VFD58_35625 [Blastocatellia bacterium]|nr:hypothetical protein [Blastocatellia bacterium]